MPKKVRVLSNVSMDAVPFDALFAGNEPVILKGLASQWPMVLAGQNCAQTLIDMLTQHYDGKPVLVYEGEPEMRGRYTYNETVSGFNFDTVRRDLSEVLSEIIALPQKDNPSYYYMNSITFDQTFSGLDKANTLMFNHPEFETYPRTSKIWIGNQSRASAHYDMPKNIACCVYGKRRFTLFPPTQTPNLYPGPLFPTPGGQVVTMADLQEPDFERCGGTRSRPLTTLMSWSITGGHRHPAIWAIRWMPSCMLCSTSGIARTLTSAHGANYLTIISLEMSIFRVTTFRKMYKAPSPKWTLRMLAASALPFIKA